LLRVAKVIVAIAGFGIAFLGLLAGVWYIIPPFVSGGEIDLSRATMGASLVALGAGLGLPLAWQGLSSLRGRPSRLFRPRPAWVLVPLFTVAVILGQAVLTLDLLPALTFPPFYVLAAVLPPLFFLAFVGRKLAESGIRWREVVLQLASGAFLATFGAFGLEAVFGLLAMVVVLVLAALMPGGDAWVQELSAYLQDPRLFQGTENLYGPLPSLPILIILGLIVLVIGPMVEEMFKSLGVVMMSYRRPGKAQAFFWGLTGGAGFALAEALVNGASSLEGWVGVATMARWGYGHALPGGRTDGPGLVLPLCDATPLATPGRLRCQRQPARPLERHRFRHARGLFIRHIPGDRGNWPGPRGFGHFGFDGLPVSPGVIRHFCYLQPDQMAANSDAICTVIQPPLPAPPPNSGGKGVPIPPLPTLREGARGRGPLSEFLCIVLWPLCGRSSSTSFVTPAPWR